MSRLASAIWLLVFVALTGSRARAVELGVQGDRFTLDGKPAFLLGCSYYGALGASTQTLRSDLDELQRRGFNWIRVFADWTPYTDLSAVDGSTGNSREPYLSRLASLCEECDRRGMVVDVTLARGIGGQHQPLLRDPSAHRHAVETLVTALRKWKNWYLDLANERNVGDARFTSIDELAELRAYARRLNPSLLVTASNGGDGSLKEVRAYLQTAHLDFLSIHRPRDAKGAAEAADMTRQYRAWIRQIGPIVPLQYDEPFRRGYGDWEPTAADFSRDLDACQKAGAAGWCFHNGDTRTAPDRQPRRAFDLRTRSLFQQLDPEERALWGCFSMTAYEIVIDPTGVEVVCPFGSVTRATT